MITEAESAAIAAQPPADPLVGEDLAFAGILSVLILALVATKITGMWE